MNKSNVFYICLEDANVVSAVNVLINLKYIYWEMKKNYDY